MFKQTLMGVLCLFGAALSSSPSALAANPPYDVVARPFLFPLLTGPASTAQPLPSYAAMPAAHANRNGTLVLFLGGTDGAPNGYAQIAQYLASQGFMVLVPSYFNVAPASICVDNAGCYLTFRGETVFGELVSYPNAFDNTLLKIDADNSIVGRTVHVLDFLANDTANAYNPDTSPADWNAFLKTDQDGGGPYARKHGSNTAPRWDRIILAGHSQGGGHAAFLAKYGPEAVKRLVMFSAPNDQIGLVDRVVYYATHPGMIPLDVEELDLGDPAPWMYGGSTTPLDRYYGLRHKDDILLGPAVPDGWAALGMTGPVKAVGRGTINPAGAHKLQMSAPNLAPNLAHNCTAANDPTVINPPPPLGALAAVTAAIPDQGCPAERSRLWKYLFTGMYP